MILFENLDLLSVGITVAATVVLGFSVYFTDRKNATNKTFFAFSLITAIWGGLNFLSYRVSNIELAFWFLRTELALGVWQAFLLFLFFTSFYSVESKSYNKIHKLFLLPLVILTSLLCLTPLVFVGVNGLTSDGFTDTIKVAPGILLFGLVSVGLVIAGFVSLFKKMSVLGIEGTKRFLGLMFWGSLLMFVPLIILNFIFPAFLNNSRFVPFGAVTIFPFIAFTSYAILRHKLFNVRAVWAGVLVFLLSVTAFLEVIFAQEIGLVVYRGAVFLLILVFGILLIKGIIREMKQREEIQDLAGRLKNVNSILAHDVKATLGKNKDMFITLMDGTFGSIGEKARPFLEKSLGDTKKLLDIIINILAAGRDMVLTIEPFNLKNAVLEVVKDVTKDAEAKHLTVKMDIPDGIDYTITADKTQLSTHVLKNLIENAVNYNLENGSVTIRLSKKDAQNLLFTVSDTGIGIKEEDWPNMFKEGGRGKESTKVNVHSSGYGLATAKKTAEAHGGKIWFESAGVPGKGATFFVELPTVAKTDNKNLAR